MMRMLSALFVVLVSAAFTIAMAEHKDKDATLNPGSHASVKMAQGILKAVDPLNHTITMDMGVIEEGRIVEHQMITLRVTNEAFEQIHRVGKKGERLELRLSGDDVVQAATVGTGP